MRTFFPVGEAAQADYERLRAAVLEGTPLADPLAARFERGGLCALVGSASVNQSACFAAEVVGARRPGWSPYVDPRLEVLADAYGLVIAMAGNDGAFRTLTSKEA